MKTAQLLLAIVLAAPIAARAADIPPLESAWYRVEILIFERNFAASDANSGEILALQAPRAFPLAAQVLVDDERARAAAYPLDAATRAEPALPAFDGPRNPPVVPIKPAPPTPKTEPTPMQRAADIVAAYEADLRSNSLRPQPGNSLLLRQEGGRLQRDAAYRILLHAAWIQPVPDRDRPMPLLIQTGERIGNAWRIEGTIDVTLARYLHVDARLWYRPDPTGPAPAQMLDAAASAATTDDVYLELREQRRVRSGELHYFDHPKFGMLLRIDPVQMPDTVLAQLSAILGAPVAQPKDVADTPEQAPITGPARIP